MSKLSSKRPVVSAGGSLHDRGWLMTRVAVCLLALVTVVTAFAAHLLSRPPRTPILTLSSSYGPDWDLNAWVEEDVRRVSGLAEQTFEVSPLSVIGRLSAGFWDDADAALQGAFHGDESVPVLFYINLHAAVDDEGRACLIPPKASVQDASTWFPIEHLLDHVAKAQVACPRKPVVMLLECGKLRSHLPAGITVNDFDDRLQSLVASHHKKYPASRMMIVSSAARGQQSWHSRLGDGNIFTRSVVEALSGMADGVVAERDRDGWVDSEEFVRYVRVRTGTWSVKHRGLLQSPTQYSTEGEPFVIAQVGNAKLSKSFRRTAPPSRAQVQRMQNAMARAERVRGEISIDRDALGWARIQRTLHAIEQSTYGGLAARRSTERWYNRFDRQLIQLGKKGDTGGEASASYLDLISLSSAHAVWTSISKRPSIETAKAALTSLDRDHLTPVPCLHAMVSQKRSRFWRDTDLIKRVATARAQWLACLRALPDSIFPGANMLAQPVQTRWRELADAVLADGGGVGSNKKAEETHRIESATTRLEASVSSQIVRLNQLGVSARARDEAFVDLPPLCQWLDDSNMLMKSSEVDLVRGSVAAVAKLDEALNRFAAGTETWTPSWHRTVLDRSAQASEFTAKLRSLHNQALQQVSGSEGEIFGSTAGTLAGAIRCTRIPQNPHHRAHASDRLQELEEVLSKRVASHDELMGAVKSVAPVPSVAAVCVAALLGIDEAQATPRAVRASLRQYGAPNADGDPDQRSWRRVVSLILDESFFATVAQSQMRDRRYRIASMAEETMDDFWYEPAVADRPHFVNASRRLLDAADAILPDSARWKERKDELEAQLSSRRVAANEGILVMASSDPSYSDGGKKAAKVAIDFTRGKGAVPEGVGLVSVEQQGVVDTSPVLLSSKKLKQTHLSLQQWNGDAAVAKLMFRGNAFRAAVSVSDTSRGVSVDRHPKRNGAKITVTDGVARGRAIAFVLDCSASMNEPVYPEIARGNGNANKLDAARSALVEMLRRLTLDRTDVGLVLYGHRMAVGKDRELLLQRRYHKRFPFSPTLQPFEDVEVALPTGRFGDEEWSAARQRLAALVPWGQTPLFLSISAAIQDVSGRGDGIAKDVIVISDGRNYQFNPRSDAEMKMDEVIRQARDRHVRVHVIGFGLDQEDETTLEQFESIASGTGGQTCNDATESSRLLSQLQKLTATEGYEIGNGSDTFHAALGKTIEVPTVNRVNTQVQLHIGEHSGRLPVSPGSHLRLTTDPAGGAPLSLPYRTGWSADQPLIGTDQLVSQTRMAIHQPRRTGENLKLQFSLQRDDKTVAKRPELVWIEVCPQRSSSGNGSSINGQPVYRIGAVNWINDMVCPVADFQCQRWPEESDRYRVEAWCLDHRPTGTHVEIPTTPSAEYQQLDSVDGVRYRVERFDDGFQVRLRYDGMPRQELADAMLIVQSVDSDYSSETHWYDAVRGSSVHSFLARTDDDALGESGHGGDSGRSGQPASVRFWVCPIRAAKAGATRTQHAIEGSVDAPMAVAPATLYR